MTASEAADELESIARQLRCGDYCEPSEMILIARDDHHRNIITFHRWGEETRLLEDTWKEKRPNA
jgi:hypothetical protein